MASYWDKVLDKRVSRRRALAASGGLAMGAAILSACGGGGEEGGGGGAKDTSGLITTPEDTSKSAKRGGVFKTTLTGEPNHFDGGIQGQIQLNVLNGLAYGGLVQNKPGVKEPSSNTEVVPDLAESWEFSPDKTELTFKLRQGVKWHNKPPVSGRLFDSSDVVATWKRYEAKGGNRAANANSVTASAPILSVTAPDAKTVVYKLKEPTSFILQRLANMVTGEAGTMMPRETESGFDPKTGQIGTGGYIQDKYTPSVGSTYKRNPDYWNKTEPYFDTIEIPTIPQYATALPQFKAGSIYASYVGGFVVQAQDVVATKKDTSALKMYKLQPSGANPSAMVGFGWLPIGGQKSPFLDVRVRQALALSYDRDAFIDTFGNVAAFEAEGLPVDTQYFTSMAYVPDVSLDPRTKEFGENAKYYTYDPAEAKKLLSAAYPSGMPEFPSQYISQLFFGPDFHRQVAVLDGWATEVGFKLTPKPIDYNIDYLPKIVTQQGKFEGWAYRFGATSSLDSVDYFVWRYWSKAGATSGALGFDVGGRGDQSGDPEVDRLIEKAKAELDVKKQTALLHDLQRYLGKMQYGVTRPGQASGFTLAWPAVANYQVFLGDSRGIGSGIYTWWLDDTKAPITKA